VWDQGEEFESESARMEGITGATVTPRKGDGRDT